MVDTMDAVVRIYFCYWLVWLALGLVLAILLVCLALGFVLAILATLKQGQSLG
jgi:flagellar biosynthesis protein FliQ